MKHTDARALIDREWLAFVRDQTPTVEEFVNRFGGPGGQVFHVLRKALAILVEDNLVRLNPLHMTSDGEHFVWGNCYYRFDSDEVMIVCRGKSKKSGG